MYKYLLLPVLCIALLGACNKSEFIVSEVELIVASETVMAVDVSGAHEQPFLQVKEAGDDSEYWLMIHGIDGFEYEPGYEYLLKVEKRIPRKPVEDISFRYFLIKIISKTKK